MSRSNYDKPFYVDVGSIAAVRCQSNGDVLDRFNHVRLWIDRIEKADEMCDRMNAEVEKFVSAKDAEIAMLRALVKEMADKLECCESIYQDLQMFNGLAEINALVARAREVCANGK